METRKVDGANVLLALCRDSTHGLNFSLYPLNFKQLNDVAIFSSRTFSICSQSKSAAPRRDCDQRTRLRNGAPNRPLNYHAKSALRPEPAISISICICICICILI